jgi:hypothetical protein
MYFYLTGSSDDTVSCAVMLEVLRVMSQSKHQYLHSITFIFNGAEETILQVFHLFLVFSVQFGTTSLTFSTSLDHCISLEIFMILTVCSDVFQWDLLSI